MDILLYINSQNADNDIKYCLMILLETSNSDTADVRNPKVQAHKW